MAIYLDSIRQFFTSFFKKEKHEEERVTKFEAYINVLYNVLIWEDITLSSIALIVMHLLFWVILQFELRLYGVFFLTLLIFFVLDASFENIITRTEKPIPVKNIREGVRFANTAIHYLSVLRKEHPGTFCIGMCISFLLLSIIGRTVSGLLLSYFGLLTVILTPAVIRSLPPHVTEGFKHAFLIISSDEGVVDETELLPTAHDEDGMDDGESTKTDQTAESCANSFISGVISMPSYLEAEGSVDGLEEEEFELSRNMRGVTPSNLSDSSDSDIKDIKFETTHFKGDSSSDEDNNYVQGLTFTEVDVVDKKQMSLTQQLGSDLLSNLGAMGSSLVSSVFKKEDTKITVRKSDSDSDFEIINSDEFQSET